MAEWAIAPAQTIIEDGALRRVGPVARRLAAHAVAVGGSQALHLTSESILSSLRAAGVACLETIEHRGECCPTGIRRIADRLASDCVAIAVGGGKAIDTVKAAARESGAPLITIPTSPATCAATTALSVIHTEDGAYEVGKICAPAPEATILDLEVLATAPRRLVAAGLADAWARSLETGLAASVDLPTGASVLSFGVSRGYAERILLEEGRAVLDKGLAAGTNAFERVMSACILGAGVASGLCGGFFLLSIAHSIAYGLTHLMDPDAALHGETIAIGLLVQALLEDTTERRFEEVDEVLNSWHLPVRLDELPGVSPDSAFQRRLARLALGTLDHGHAVPFDVTDVALEAALERVASR